MKRIHSSAPFLSFRHQTNLSIKTPKTHTDTMPFVLEEPPYALVSIEI